MIVSALLTSVGINFSLCVLFFALYSILRKQPGNFLLYLPRLLAEKGIERNHSFHLRQLLPSPRWLSIAWNLSEEDLLSISGLDAVVFMRTIILSLKVFSFAGIIGLLVLLPINCLGTQLGAFDITVISSETLDLFTISNVNNESKWLWVHCSAVYMITAFVCFLLHNEYRYICTKRIEYFHSSKPQPHQFTILIREIPVPAGSSVSQSVDQFFTKYYPLTYLSHVVIHRSDKLRNLIKEGRELYRRLAHLRLKFTKQNSKNDGHSRLLQSKVDLEKKLGDLEVNLRVEQSDISLARQEVRSAFVSFRSRHGAEVALKLQQSEKPTEWISERAPEPDDVYWPFFHSSFLKRWISKVVVVVTYILLTIVFLIPVVIAQGLANLSQLKAWFPFLESILNMTIISRVVTGYLPNLILHIAIRSMPPVMQFLSSIQGHISFSEIQRSACNKVLWFIVWNIFFANVLSGSALNQLSVLLDLKNIPTRLAVGVPAQASFFIAYVVTSGWTSTSSELFRVNQFILSLLRKFCCCCDTGTPDEFGVPYISYHWEIPRILFFGLLGTTYFFLAPLMLPFLLAYFLLAYVIFKNQFINVYAPKFESAGRFWPIVHNSMIFSLALMHAIALGIFTVKKVTLASWFVFPLPILTLLFNEYCRKRFLPNFIAYSAKDLIDKDREDSSNPEMQEFYSQLVTAYKDPALCSVQFSNSHDQREPNVFGDRTTPLLSHLQVSYPQVYI